jgi:hypothetical protein
MNTGTELMKKGLMLRTQELREEIFYLIMEDVKPERAINDVLGGSRVPVKTKQALRKEFLT